MRTASFLISYMYACMFLRARYLLQNCMPKLVYRKITRPYETREQRAVLHTSKIVIIIRVRNMRENTGPTTTKKLAKRIKYVTCFTYRRTHTEPLFLKCYCIRVRR